MEFNKKFILNKIKKKKYNSIKLHVLNVTKIKIIACIHSCHMKWIQLHLVFVLAYKTKNQYYTIIMDIDIIHVMSNNLPGKKYSREIGFYTTVKIFFTYMYIEVASFVMVENIGIPRKKPLTFGM